MALIGTELALFCHQPCKVVAVRSEPFCAEGEAPVGTLLALKKEIQKLND